MEIPKFLPDQLPQVISLRLSYLPPNSPYSPEQVQSALISFLVTAQEVRSDKELVAAANLSLENRTAFALQKAQNKSENTGDGEGWFTVYSALCWLRVQKQSRMFPQRIVLS